MKRKYLLLVEYSLRKYEILKSIHYFSLCPWMMKILIFVDQDCFWHVLQECHNGAPINPTIPWHWKICIRRENLRSIKLKMCWLHSFAAKVINIIKHALCFTHHVERMRVSASQPHAFDTVSWTLDYETLLPLQVTHVCYLGIGVEQQRPFPF